MSKNIKTNIPRDENYSKNYSKKWYEANKEKHKKYLMGSIICPNCHAEVAKVNIARHKNTRKCKMINAESNESMLSKRIEEYERRLQILEDKTNQTKENTLL